jgi:hypothetical protein
MATYVNGIVIQDSNNPFLESPVLDNIAAGDAIKPKFSNVGFAQVTVATDAYISGLTKLQSKNVTPSDAEQTVEADSGYIGLSSVVVAAIPVEAENLAIGSTYSSIYVDKSQSTIFGTLTPDADSGTNIMLGSADSEEVDALTIVFMSVQTGETTTTNILVLVDNDVPTILWAADAFSYGGITVETAGWQSAVTSEGLISNAVGKVWRIGNSATADYTKWGSEANFNALFSGFVAE